MASPNVVNIIRVPGRLIASPANLNSPPAYGGTQLGIHRDMEIRLGAQYYEVKAEEFGSVPVEVIYAGQTCEFRGVARGVDAAMIASLWPSGAASDNPISGTKAGKLMSSSSLRLLFAPLDTVNHPFVLIYKAVPTIPEGFAMPFTRSEEIAFPFAFKGIPDSSGRVYAVGQGISL